MADHALLSPSSAERWLHCTPSARAEYQEPDMTSVFAEEGSLAHHIAEVQLRHFNGELTDGQRQYRINKAKKHELYYEGMLDEIDEYVTFCIETFNATKGAEMTVEQRIDLSSHVPEGFGTGDCVIVSPELVHIIDLKFGKGVVVDAFENTQLKLYALGAYDFWSFILDDIKTIRVTIAQVRLGEINSYEMDVADLLAWGEEIKPLAKLAYQGKGSRVPGDWCRFCKVRQSCRVRTEQLLDGIDTDNRPDELSDEEISDLLHRADDLTAWAKELKDFALDQALSGKYYRGWKLVEGRSVRKITDEAAFAKALLDAGYEEDTIYRPKALEGITNLTKALGKTEFNRLSQGYIEKPPGKPTLVEESDKRPALNSAINDFEFE